MDNGEKKNVEKKKKIAAARLAIFRPPAGQETDLFFLDSLISLFWQKKISQMAILIGDKIIDPGFN